MHRIAGIGRNVVFIGCVALSAFARNAAPAQTIYQQNPGPAPSASLLISSTLNNFGQSPGFRTADNFALTAGGRIDEIRWWGDLNSGGLDFSFTFYASAGIVPGAMLHTTGGSLATQIVNVGSSFDPVTFYTSVLTSPFLAEPGTSYWLSVFNQAPDASWRWLSAQVAGGGCVQGLNPGPPWSTVQGDRAYQLATIPEPTTAMALAPIVLLLAALRSARHRACRARGHELDLLLRRSGSFGGSNRPRAKTSHPSRISGSSNVT